MEPTIEKAPSGRAKCRGCGEPIGRGELRLGEHLPNPFAEEGPMTLWFHLRCGAYKRPEVMLAALASTALEIGDRQVLSEAAQRGIDHRRLPRASGAERAPTGRARCRSCREPIARTAWRIPLVFYEEGRLNPGGFVHVTCSKEYFGTTDVVDRLMHFSPKLGDDEVAELKSILNGS